MTANEWITLALIVFCILGFLATLAALKRDIMEEVRRELQALERRIDNER